MIPILSLWISLIVWSSSEIFPRIYDDWKNLVLYLGCTLLIFVKVSRQNFNSIIITPINLVVIIYMMICGLSLLAASEIHEGWNQFFQLSLLIGLVWAVANIPWKDFISLFKVLGLLCLSVSIFSLYNLGYSHFQSNASFPISQNSSYYADFMVLNVPVYLVLLILVRRGGARFYYGFAGILAIAMLWISAARSSLIALFVTILLGSRYMVKKIMRYWKQCAGVLVLTFTCLTFIIANVDSMRASGLWVKLISNQTDHKQNFESINLYSGNRLAIYMLTLDGIIKKPLLGYGLNEFRFRFPEFITQDRPVSELDSNSWLMHPHNEILHQWFELGILGLGCFLTFFVLIYVYGIRSLKKLSDIRIKLLLSCALLMLSISLISWQFNTAFLYPISRLYLAISLAVILKSIQSDLPILFQFDFPKLKQVFMFLTLIALCGICSYHYSLYSTQKYYLAKSIEERNRWLNRALFFAPYAFDPQLMEAEQSLKELPFWESGPKVESLYQKYPHVPQVLWQMSVLRLKQGAPKFALPYLEELVRINPSHPIAPGLIEKIKIISAS